MSKLRRGPWSQREDATLIRLVQQQGPLNWVKISDTLVSRSPKQCRERYHQNLKPSLNHEPISIEEGQLIEKLVNDLGKRWAEIARRLNNRSDNAVKNWWNGNQNRRRRSMQRRRPSCPYDGHQSLSHAAASLDQPRRPQLGLETETRMLPADHRHEAVSPCAVSFSLAMHNTAPPSGLPSPNSDRGSLYSVPIALRDTTPSLPLHSSISLPPLRRSSYDTATPALRLDPLLPPVTERCHLRLPPIQTLEIGERHPLPTAPNSPLEPASSCVQQHHGSPRLPRCQSRLAQMKITHNDEGDARLRVSHLVD
ncbi:Homeodomain-like protein [Nemania sp. NC0429]|nr:Homeodomain-like protein [Nemania sp. NC0429]